MKKPFILFYFFFLITTCYAQKTDIDYSNTIKEQAEKMAELLIKKDYYSFSKYTYPRIVEMMGGQQKMVEVLEKGSNEMEVQGTSFARLLIGNPSKVIIVGNELQCTLPQTIEMTVRNGRLVSKSTLIGISTNNGKSWYFVDTSGKNIQEMKKILPNLSDELIIPKKTQPILYPK